mmetsp:Transcript_49788/g.115574  ORF Transcript_49788/g.115574 Transcript_49788/m.115574 type:complete len:267 (+) Transcript_49788:1-801(+)
MHGHGRLLPVALLSLVLGHPAEASRAQRAGGRQSGVDNLQNPVLDTPDLTAYDPVQLLCSQGGSNKLQAWCKDWLACIRQGAAPEGTKAAVLAAWKPADCREVCGEWPVLSSPPKNSSTGVNGTVAAFFQGARDCDLSCHNFQGSLSSCVATILFEPGKVAVMGALGQDKPAPPSHCLARNTSCMPDLPVRYQRCVAKAVKLHQECSALKAHVKDCSGCPQLEGTYVSEYHTFVGGCKDQLNAYWQATHPQAGMAALPEATGCKVH